MQNDTREIVKPKDITEGIARMMMLEICNYIGNPDSFDNPSKFENLEILCSRLDLILGSRTPLLKTEKILQFWDKKCKINVHD